MFRILMVSIAFGLTGAELSAQELDPAKQSVVVDGGGIIIATSESGKTLYGYSVHTGTWDGVAVNNPDKSRLVPVVGAGIGYVVVGKRIHAFSSATGRWAVVELAEVASPMISAGKIRVDVGSKINMYSGLSGKWAIVDLAADKSQEVR